MTPTAFGIAALMAACAAGITGTIGPILTAAEASGTTLFMGPGLLAGGTLKNGKGNTPGNQGAAP